VRRRRWSLPIETDTALIYLRISANRTGEHASIQQQRDDCTALAGRLCRSRIIEFVDEAVSAYQDRTRPAYQRLLRQIEQAPSATLVVWHLDRLYRKPGELEQLLDLLDTRPIRVEAVQDGSFDLNRHEGRLFARQLVAFANYESALRSARVSRAHQQRARRAAWHGRAAYGHRPGGEPDADQAPTLRRIARDYLVGCSETEIARRLNTEGVPTPGASHEWHPSTVQAILRSDRLHRRRTTWTGEQHIEGTWESVITRDESELIRALQLLSQRRTTNSSRSLLGGLARCATCDRRMVVAYSGGSGRVRRYVCLRRDGGCGNGIAADAADRVIRARLRTAAMPERTIGSAQGLAEEAAKLRQLRMGNAAAYGGGSRRHDTFSTISRDLQQAADRLSSAAVAAAPALHGDWDELPLPEQRRRIQQQAETVLVEPSRSSGKFDPDRIRVQWRAQEADASEE
jgi:DNA invertase Pin-like site-specific DNA recombinase